VERQLSNEQPIVSTDTWRPAILLALLLASFALFGAIIGAQGVLWADIVQALRLTKSVFGIVQLLSPLLSVGLLLAGGLLVAWVGKQLLSLIALTMLAISMLALGGAGELWGLVGALLLAGIGNGLFELGMNGAALDWEQATRRPVMNIMHAC